MKPRPRRPVKIVPVPGRRRSVERFDPLPRRFEIVRGGDLHVPGIAVHDVDLVPRALGEKRLVGRVDPRAAGGDGGGEDLAPETLGRLREIDALAGNGVDDDGALGAPLDPLHRVARLQRRDRRAVRQRRVDRPIDQAGRHERTRRVVNQHDIREGDHGIEGVGHRVLAALAARDDSYRRHARRVDTRQRQRGRSRRHHDDDLGDPRVSQERLDAVLQHRPAADVEHLLRLFG